MTSILMRPDSIVDRQSINVENKFDSARRSRSQKKRAAGSSPFL